MDTVLLEILKSDPQVVLVILSEPAFEKALETRFLASMKVHSSRVYFVPRTKDRFSFRELLATVDLIIDPWPWGGWTTTLQALCAQTPVVTLPGRDARSRFTLNAYMSVGLQDLVAHNTSHFVEIAQNCDSKRSCKKLKLAAKSCYSRHPDDIRAWILSMSCSFPDEEFRAS